VPRLLWLMLLRLLLNSVWSSSPSRHEPGVVVNAKSEEDAETALPEFSRGFLRLGSAPEG